MNMPDTDLDFLNESVTDNSPETTTENTGPDTNVADASADDSAQAAGSKSSKYTNIIASYGEGDPEIPAGLQTVTEFANELTVRNITQLGLGAPGVVDKAGVYASMKATKNPLPVVMVGNTAFLPKEAVAVWDAKPARGEGSGTTSGGKLEDDDLLRLAGDVRDKVSDLEKRLARTAERLENTKKLMSKRTAQLQARFGDEGWAKVEEYQATHEATIPDDNEKTDAKSE